MPGFRNKRLQASLALFVATVFFAGQANACCMATRDLASLLSSAFRSAPADQAHACCPKPEASPAKAEGDCATKACCIQDGTQKPPQLASAPAGIPDLSGSGTLAFVRLPAPALPAPLAARSAADTGPPVWLRTVRILV